MPSSEQKLLLLTIGPVQKFIAQARKTQDLWAGSYLLSHLVYTARNEATCNGVTNDNFIFPAQDALTPPLATFPNRLLFTCSDPDKVVTRMRSAVTGELEAICAFALDYLESKSGDNLGDDRARVAEHVAGFLVLTWAAVDFAPDDYADCLKSVEQRLGGIKNLRRFKQLAEERLKCPLCGERQALAPNGTGNRSEVLQFWRKIAARDPRFRDRDTLCTICAGKRLLPNYLAEKNSTAVFSFPSTPEIASSSFKLRLAKATDRNRWQEFTDCLPANPGLRQKLAGTMVPLLQSTTKETTSLDGHWLHRENYRDPPTLFTEQPERDQLETVRRKVADFLQQQKCREPSAYYAVLFGDGDEMGKTIAAFPDRQSHRDFSEALAGYASKKVPEIIEKQHPGQLIYAGGDDFAALLPLDTVLNVIAGLRTSFHDFMEKKLGLDASISFGLCLAHCKAPFSLVLNQARARLSAAKQQAPLTALRPKDTTGIICMSHGGNHQATLVPHGYRHNGRPEDGIALLQELYDRYRNGLSKRYPMAVYQSLRELADHNQLLADPGSRREDLIRAELARLLRRATTPPIDGPDAEELAGKLTSLLSNIHLHSLEKFLGFLQLGAFLAREAQP